MKINAVNNIFFQKKLIANCKVKSDKKSIPCSFYQLEDKDRDYFIKLIHAKGWENYYYAMIIDGDIRRRNVDKIYVLEDEKSNCLGYMKVDTHYGDRNFLEFIEVRPDYRAKKSKKKRYIGETMLNFLAQLTKEQDKQILSVPYPDSDAVEFYEKCHFAHTGIKRAVILSEENMDELKKSNLAHTGSSVDFIW